MTITTTIRIHKKELLFASKVIFANLIDLSFWLSAIILELSLFQKIQFGLYAFLPDIAGIFTWIMLMGLLLSMYLAFSKSLIGWRVVHTIESLFEVPRV